MNPTKRRVSTIELMPGNDVMWCDVPQFRQPKLRSSGWGGGGAATLWYYHTICQSCPVAATPKRKYIKIIGGGQGVLTIMHGVVVVDH